MDTHKFSKNRHAVYRFLVFLTYTFHMATTIEKSIPQPISVDHSALDAVSNGLYYDPHTILGGHVHPAPDDDFATVRVLKPLAKTVTIITQDGSYATQHEWNGVFTAVIPAIRNEEGPAIPSYRVLTKYENGKEVLEDDPYRYLPTVGAMDIYLFGEGRHERMWAVLGAHVHTYDDVLGEPDGSSYNTISGTAFACWAPNARAVRVVGDFNSWGGRQYAMRELGSSGIWELFIPGLGDGTKYKYEILNANGEWKQKADPMERCHEIPPLTASIVVDSRHEWQDDAWMDHRRSTNPH